MRKYIYLLLCYFIFPFLATSQNFTQIVRGKITDTDTKSPLVAATIIIVGTDPVIGTTTDVDGNFRLNNIAVGRITIQISYAGYETKTMTDIVVNAGKEVVLDISLQEAVQEMNEVVVKAARNKGEAINKMSLLSARSVSPEEANRYAGAFNDPSLTLTNFAGVNRASGNNNIIVRGNAPKYMQYRLEGVEITNPNHFDDQNSSSPGVSALNNNMLTTSDFYTGAFSPEYGDVLSGIYDVKLRTGNNEKFESIFGFGIIGTDFTVEGPFKKGYSGSYVANYRYSTAAIITDLGLVHFGGVPKYQDASFKVVLPTKKIGTFSVFGLAGLSSFFIKNVKQDFMSTPGDAGMQKGILEDLTKRNYLFNTGVSHVLTVGKKSSITSTLAFSSTGNRLNVDQGNIITEIDGNGVSTVDTTEKTPNFQSNLVTSAYRLAVTYNTKFSSRSRLQVGVKYTLSSFHNTQSQLAEDSNVRITLVDFSGQIGLIRNFVSWSYSLSKKIRIVSGLHYINVLYNNKGALEPRVAMRVQLNNKNSVHAGFGKHSTMERVHNYFNKVYLPDGSTVEPNHGLGLLKAYHYVAGYEKRFTDNLMLKVETYYQHLYNLPVENLDTSNYSTINEGEDYRYVPLVNKGTGRNYGVELTLERFFNKNYYFLINTSIFDSKYKALDGKMRNTAYNNNFVANILCGKEFINLGKKKNQVLSLNSRIYYGGGMRYIPLLRDEHGNLAIDPKNNKFWDYSKAYDKKLDNIFSLTVSASYKWNKPKTTHQFFLSIENITNNQARISEYYDSNQANSIGYRKQTAMFPNFMYRVYF